MRTLRAVARLLGVALFTAIAVLGIASARVISWFSTELGDDIERRNARLWARNILRVLGLRVTCEGIPPRGRFLLTSNHLSYLDIVALMSVIDVRFISKMEVASWPLIGPVARFAGTLFVDRSKRSDLPRVIAELEEVFAGERAVAFFPEGTSSSGFEVLPFKPSLFEAAARGDLQIACAALRYSTPPHEPPAELSVCWWGDTGFFEHFWSLLQLSRCEGEIRFSEVRLVNSDRKLLAQAAHDEVVRLFRPVCDEDPSSLAPSP